MIRLFIWGSATVLLLAPAFGFGVESSNTDKWKMIEMADPGEDSLKKHLTALDRREPDARRDEPLGVRSNARLDGSAEPFTSESCDATECFRLYYFRGEHFKKGDSSRKNILFIPGGPGDISPRSQGLASILENESNVIYFDPRGAGLSHFGGDDEVSNSDVQFGNSFDQFLRAKFTVGDIERIRRAELGPDGKWDAIYGHSYGTVVAQQYANVHPEFVERLILSAPIDRHKETESARTDRVLQNLDKIYTLIRFKNPTASCVIGDEKHIFEAIRKVLKGERPPEPEFEVLKPIRLNPDRKPPIVHCNDDFSFLDTATQVPKIKLALKDIYEQVEKNYGSANFLVLNFDKVEKDNEFKNRFPYPKQFFVALSEVQRLGAPDLGGNFYAGEIGDLVRVAIVLGYYAMFDIKKTSERRDASSEECKIDAPFIDGLTSIESKQVLCDRISRAISDTGTRSRIESRRALYVLGIYDGIFRWIFRFLDDRLQKSADCPNGFVTGRDLFELTKKTTTHKMLQDELSKVGITDLKEPICAWDPGRFKHGVQTLFLKGGADAVIAGKQAEDFFNNGLTDPRRHGVLIEFPGMGHDPNIPFFPTPLDGVDPAEPTKFATAYATLLTKFLSQSVSQFRRDDEVKDQLKLLGAKEVTP